MKFFTRKRSIIGLIAVVAVAAMAFGAYAYFTNSGNGSNSSASVGSVTNALDVAVTLPSPQTYYPTAVDSGNKVVNTYTTTVTNQDEAAEATSQIVYTITTDKGGCTQADFAINGGATGASSTVPFVHDLAPNSDHAPADQATDTATVQMIDTGLPQNNCQGAVVTLHAAVS